MYGVHPSPGSVVVRSMQHVHAVAAALSQLQLCLRLTGSFSVARRPNLQYEVIHKEDLGMGSESEAMEEAVLQVINLLAH